MKAHHLLLFLPLILLVGCETDTDGTAVADNLITTNTVCPSTLQAPRTIAFAGRTWEVRDNPAPLAAGLNCFAGDKHNAWVDENDRLHLKITSRNDIWTCAEIYSTGGYGYGTYTFRVASPVGGLDRNVVLGLFTWDQEAPRGGKIHEIDIEFTPWSRVWGENLHYSVQPVMGPDTSNGQYDERNDATFLSADVGLSVHQFTWTRTYVDFASYVGPIATGTPLHAWRFTNANPARRSNESTLATPVLIPTPSSGTSLRLNLWLNDGDRDGFGDAPTNGKEPEVIIDQFTFTPAAS